ncbi:MAG: hypothetical protein IJN25_02825 [Clostridia bacterium]|nr:hypothetical protein [Clostridia bacterium]
MTKNKSPAADATEKSNFSKPKNKERSIAMLKKWTGLFLAMVLVTALCPAVAMAENTNSWSMEGVTAGTNATVAFVTEEVYGNTSEKLKIEHTENTETTVTLTITQTADEKRSAGYYVPFVLQSLTEGDGVQLSMKTVTPDSRERNYQTSFFKDTTYTKWRKMMTFTSGWVAEESELTVTFKGVGVLYLDDVEIELTPYIVNGGFEGLSGDGVFASMPNDDATSTIPEFWTGRTTAGSEGFIFSVKPGETIEQVCGTSATSWRGSIIMVEEAENNYVVFYGNSAGTQITYRDNTTESGWINGRFAIDNMESGKSYRVVVSNKANAGYNGVKFTMGTGANLPSNLKDTKPSTNWEDKSVAFLYRFGASSDNVNKNSWGVQFFSGSKYDTTSTANGLSYLDNLRLEEIKEGVSLANADGENITSLERGEVSLAFEKPMFNSLADTYDTVKTEGDTGVSAAKISVAVALFKKEGAARQLVSVELLPDLMGVTEADGIKQNGEDTVSLSEVGFLPANAEVALDIPATGDYEVRLMVWDGIGAMKPASAQVYTYTTASEA